MHDAARQRQALRLPARERTHALIGLGTQPHTLHQLIGQGAALTQPVHAGEEAQILTDGQVLIHTRLMAHVADHAANLVGIARRLQPGHPHLAGGRPHQRRQHAQQCRLARAVGPQ